MGAQEATETSKAPNKAPNTQETPPMPGPYAEWMGYYPVPPHMWSGQPIMPAYPIYTGVYGHPPYGQQFGMASPSSGNEGTAADAETKSENKGRPSRLKTSKGGSYSGGGESESERSSNEEKDKKSQSQEPAADASSAFNLPLTPTKSAPGSWDYFAGVGPNGAAVPPVKRGASSVAPALPAPRDASELDERELKRQRRKQSNRESARRSRQRKQAECEELAQRVETYTMDNLNLRAELEKVRAELKLLTEQNALYKKQLAEKQSEQSETKSAGAPKAEAPKLQPSSEGVTA